MFLRYSLLISFFLLSSAPLFAASQNKLISKKFDWQVAQTPHFDLYFYPGAEKLLPAVASQLEKSYDSVTQYLGVSIPGRSPFFLFLNHNEFEQNNIVDVGEGTGGVTEAFKNRFLVFNDGTQKWLEHVIVHEFTHVAQFHVFYSGFWKSVRLLKSVLYPLWFVEGMAEYSSGEIDEVLKEMVLRDAVTSKMFIPLPMLHGFNHVKPHEVTLAYKTGEATLDFIAREYGKEKIGILLQNISEKYDMNSALQEVLGLSLSQLDAKLQESLEEKYAEESAGLKEPDFYGQALTRPDHLYPVFNSNPAFFPDGKEFVYLSDKEGFTEIFRYDLPLSRSLPLNIQKKFPEMVENIHRDGSALAVSPDGAALLFAGESKQRDYLYLYDTKRDRLKRIGFALDSVSSPQFSPDGKKILLVGMKDGITDIYICRKDGTGLKQLTDTFADENFCRFFPDGKKILFSREAVQHSTPSLPRRDLWSLALETGEETRLTHLSGEAIQPAFAPSGTEIVFVNDATGIPNLYKIPATGGEAVQLTEVIGGNFYPAYSFNGKEILFVSHRQGEQHIYRTSPHFLEAWRRPESGAAFQNNPLSSQQRPEERAGDLRTSSAAATPAAASNTILLGGRAYGFKASTDFFFPVLFYSSTDGLFLSAFWQASEMLGNHQVQAGVTYASALNFLNYQIFYSYLRFRPQLFLGFIGDTQDNVFTTTRERRREDAQFVGIAYPLDRFDRIQFRFLTTQRKVQFTDDNFIAVRFTGRENVASFSFLRDLSQGRYLETTRGYRILTTYEESNKAWDSTLEYRNIFLIFHHFTPVQKESTIAFRIFSGASFGQDRQIFRTGGSDLLRGYGRFDPDSAASRFVISNLEFRFPLFFDVNYHLWFLFPDFLFKNIYAAVFTDNGILWNNGDYGNLKNSMGLGLRFQTFVLQTFPVILQFDWARRTSNGDQIFYLSLGPNF